MGGAAPLYAGAECGGYWTVTVMVRTAEGL